MKTPGAKTPEPETPLGAAKPAAAKPVGLMQRVKRVLLGTLIGLALCAGGVWLLIHLLDEPPETFEGKPLFYWLSQATNQQAAASNLAVLTLRSKVVPQLTRTMLHDTYDSPIKHALVARLNELPGVNIHSSVAEGRRYTAAVILGQVGPWAAGAVPDLIQAVKGNDSAVRPGAARALGQIGSQPDTIIPLLIGLLDDKQDGVPEAAVEALGDFGRLAKPALPKLLPLLKVRDKDMQHALRPALKKIDPQAAAEAGLR